VDHTTGTSSGFYVYTEASSPNYPNMTALLEGPCVDLSGYNGASWTFSYHMVGTAMGDPVRGGRTRLRHDLGHRGGPRIALRHGIDTTFPFSCREP